MSQGTWDALALLAGLEWRPFDEQDWMAFAGAGEHAFTAERDGVLYVRSEEDGQLTVEAHSGERLLAVYTFSGGAL